MRVWGIDESVCVCVYFFEPCYILLVQKLKVFFFFFLKETTFVI